MQRSKQKKNKRAQRGPSLVALHIAQDRKDHPPQYDANTTVSRVFRFIYTLTSSPQSYTITASKLCALQVIGTTANTSATQLYEQVKIRKVEIWGSPSSGGGNTSVSLTYLGNALGVQGPNRTFSDQSMGMTHPAYICARPGKESQAAQWQSGDTNVGINTLFSMTFAGTGAGLVAPIVIDVHLTLRVTHNTRTTNNTVTLVTVALTSSYYLALDNPAGGTGSTASDLLPDRTLVNTT